MTAITYAPETRTICTIIQKLGNEIAEAGAATPEPTTQRTLGPTTRTIEVDRHYRTAYRMFSDRFRSHVSEERFIEVWSQVNRSAVRSMEWNGHIDYTTDTGSGTRRQWS